MKLYLQSGAFDIVSLCSLYLQSVALNHNSTKHDYFFFLHVMSIFVGDILLHQPMHVSAFIV